MINSQEFVDGLLLRSIRFFSGVPDSCLKDFCFALSKLSSASHVVAANEGAAVALACGWYLATAEIGLVYLQNSGLGSALNPLVSLADSEVYRIPLMLLIGVRGDTGIQDEPQHRRQGRITREILNQLGIRVFESACSTQEMLKQVDEGLEYARGTGLPFALLVNKRTFTNSPRLLSPKRGALSRLDVIELLIRSAPANAALVSSTGFCSRELLASSAKIGARRREFLVVGSMGHASSLALGLSLAEPKRRVILLDGDGAALMHLGALATIGACQPGGFVHVLFNNKVHDSVGGQSTTATEICWREIASGCGYKRYCYIEEFSELTAFVDLVLDELGPIFCEIRVDPIGNDNLPRPEVGLLTLKDEFMNFLSSEDFST